MRLDRGAAAAVAPLCLALALAGCSSSGSTAAASGGSSSGAAASSGGSAPPPSPGSSADSFSVIPSVVSDVQPSVVTINTGRGLGSGVIYKSNGLIITNDHVVTNDNIGAPVNGNHVQVQFADGKQMTGTVKATDPVTDLAIVQVDRNNLPVATFESALPPVGSLAIALGSPLGFQDTVTAGIISGLHREVPGAVQQGSFQLVDVIQTDAAISPGNSGGALVDGNKRIIGINDAYLPPKSGAVAIGFAIPASTVTKIADELIATGHATHAFLGVVSGDITPQIASQLGGVSSGAVVEQVAPNTPAAQANLQPGDVIQGVDGTTISNAEDLVKVLLDHKPGDTVSLKVVRGGQTSTIKVTLSGRPGNAG